MGEVHRRRERWVRPLHRVRVEPVEEVGSRLEDTEDDLNAPLFLT